MMRNIAAKLLSARRLNARGEIAITDVDPTDGTTTP
jgi:hypothetical protein